MSDAAKQDSGDERWDEFFGWARRFADWEDFDREERNYKLDIAAKLRAVRDDLSADPAHWQALLKAAFGGRNNLVIHYTHLPFQEWCAAEPARASQALTSLWDPSRTATESMYAFLDIVSKDIARGPGTLLNLVSCLHMAKSPKQYPVYQSTPIRKAIAITGYPPPHRDSDVPRVYQHTLGLFDRVVEEAARRGLQLRDRLEAQSLLWSVTTWRPDQSPIADWPEQDRRAIQRYRTGAE